MRRAPLVRALTPAPRRWPAARGPLLTCFATLDILRYAHGMATTSPMAGGELQPMTGWCLAEEKASSSWTAAASDAPRMSVRVSPANLPDEPRADRSGDRHAARRYTRAQR
jgi:hypothetical protein